MRASSSEFGVIGFDVMEDREVIEDINLPIEELQLAEEVVHNYLNAAPAPALTLTPAPVSVPASAPKEPPSATQAAVSGGLSTVRSKRTGRKRKHREPHSPETSPTPSPTKMSKATEWRKKQEKEIAKNDQILKNYEAEVKDKEMFILIHQAVLEGNRRQKSFDYASKMASFDAQRSYIEAGMRGLESIDRCQQMAQYKKAQVLLLKSFQSYINTLTEQILAVNKDIMEMSY